MGLGLPESVHALHSHRVGLGGTSELRVYVDSPSGVALLRQGLLGSGAKGKSTSSGYSLKYNPF